MVLITQYFYPSVTRPLCLVESHKECLEHLNTRQFIRFQIVYLKFASVKRMPIQIFSASEHRTILCSVFRWPPQYWTDSIWIATVLGWIRFRTQTSPINSSRYKKWVNLHRLASNGSEKARCTGWLPVLSKELGWPAV